MTIPLAHMRISPLAVPASSVPSKVQSIHKIIFLDLLPFPFMVDNPNVAFVETMPRPFFFQNNKCEIPAVQNNVSV